MTDADTPNKPDQPEQPGQQIPPKAKTFADSGWGIKPDDQPSNIDEAGKHTTQSMNYDSADPNMVDTILRTQRRGFNTAAKITIAPGVTTIFDLNGDGFEIRGLSYGDENLIEILKTLGAGFDPRQLRQVPTTDQNTREYTLSKSWAWGAERSG